MRTHQSPLEQALDVLVVDDDASFRKIARFALEDAGYAVYEADDGMQSLQRLRFHPRGLVVLLDLNMPKLDGWGVLRIVKAEAQCSKRHRFLLMTANSEALPSALVKLLGDLHVPVIAKPCRLDRMLDAVARAASKVETSEAQGSASVK